MVGQHDTQMEAVSVTRMDKLSSGTWLLGFQRNFEFEAGQVIGIAMEEKGPRRLYSICSGNKDPEVQVLFNVVKEGYLTPRLCDVRPGEEIWITAPRGEFICREEHAVWVAAGTGIAPFLSMVRSGRASGMILLHGERTLKEFHFAQTFRNAPALQYIPCCSGEDTGNMFHGRVSSYLQKNPLPAVGIKYYLCGSAEMVVDTRDILIEKGIPFDAIVSEIYF